MIDFLAFRYMGHPWFLLLMIPLLLLLLYMWRKKEPSLTIPSLAPFRSTSFSRPLSWRKLLPLLCFALAGFFLILGLTRPRKGTEIVRAKTDGIDIMLAVDLSGSMYATDVPQNYSKIRTKMALVHGDIPNRLEAAKREIRRFVTMRPNDRIGLVAFASHPYVVCPPTLDHDFLLANIKRLEPTMIGDGTGIAGPLSSSVSRLKNSTAKSRVIVLFTDGANTVPLKITPTEAAHLADTFDITIYTVGIGSDNAYMPDGLAGYSPYPQQFDEPLLKEIAEITGGRYYHAEDAKGLADAMADIDKLERTSQELPVMTRWREFYPETAYLAIAALMLGIILRSTVCFRYP